MLNSLYIILTYQAQQVLHGISNIAILNRIFLLEVGHIPCTGTHMLSNSSRNDPGNARPS